MFLWCSLNTAGLIVLRVNMKFVCKSGKPTKIYMSGTSLWSLYLSAGKKRKEVWISFQEWRGKKKSQQLICERGALLSNEVHSRSSTSQNERPEPKSLIELLGWWVFRARNTYRTIVLRNQGLLAMEGTASSISGCILMKLSVSSGNSLDTLYLSMDEVPAQLPGLRW